MATYTQLHDGNPDGNQLGGASTDLIGFHGATPVDQSAFAATVSVVYLTVSGIYGFSTAAAMSNTLLLINALQLALVEHGIMASS